MASLTCTAKGGGEANRKAVAAIPPACGAAVASPLVASKFGEMMFVFHTTTEEASQSILAKGFRNGLGLPTLEGFEEAVWLADIPLPYGDSTLRLDLPATLLQEHELIHDEGTGPGHREFVIPAEVLNAFPVEAYELTDADEEANRRLAEGPL